MKTPKNLTIVIISLLLVPLLLASGQLDGVVGGLELGSYCRSIGATHDVLDVSRGKFGIGCQFGSGGEIKWLTQQNLDAACHRYGPSAYAVNDEGKADTWYCKGPIASNEEPVGGIEWDRFCQSVGATHTIFTGNNPYDVACQYGSGGDFHHLSANQINLACSSHYGSKVYAKYGGSGPRSWACYENGTFNPPSGSPSGAGNNGSSDNSSQPTATLRTSNPQPTQSPPEQSPTKQPANQPTTPQRWYDGWTNQPNQNRVKVLNGIYQLILRDSPSKDSGKYGYVVEGDWYILLKEKGNYAKIQTSNGSVGWVTKEGPYGEPYIRLDHNVSNNDSSSGNETSNPQPQPSTQTCETSAYAVDEGGGNLINQGYFLYVYGPNEPEGYFKYWSVFRNKWLTVERFDAVEYRNNEYLVFGVNTWWAYLHPVWIDTAWIYVYPDCP